MDAQRGRFLEGAAEKGIGQGARLHHLRRLRQVRRVRLQQVALGALRLHHLPDGLPEGAFPAGIHRRLDDPRHGQYRQAQRIPRRREQARHRDRAALRQPLGRGVHGPRRQDLLRHRRRSRASGRRSPSTSSRRAATGRSPTSPISPPGSIRASSTGGRWKRWSMPAPSTSWCRAASRPSPRSTRSSARRSGPMPTQQRRHHGHVRLRHARADRRCRRMSPTWTLAERLEREYRRHRLPPLGASARRTTPSCSSGCGCSRWLDFERAVKEGGAAPGGSPAPSPPAATGAPARARPWRSLTLSDPTGSYEVHRLLRADLAVWRDADRRQIGDPHRRGRRAPGRRRACG